MGCGRNVSTDMLCMALFCAVINESLIDFGDEGKFHANLWIRVKGAINFLSYYPERSPEQKRKAGFDLPTYGFRSEIRRLTYEQLIVAQNFLKRHRQRLLQTKKKKLPMILDLNLGVKQRRSAARYCIKLFSGLLGEYNWYTERPPRFSPPRGIEKLLNPPKGKAGSVKA